LAGRADLIQAGFERQKPYEDKSVGVGDRLESRGICSSQTAWKLVRAALYLTRRFVHNLADYERQKPCEDKSVRGGDRLESRGMWSSETG